MKLKRYPHPTAQACDPRLEHNAPLGCSNANRFPGDFRAAAVSAAAGRFRIKPAALLPAQRQTSLRDDGCGAAKRQGGFLRNAFQMPVLARRSRKFSPSRRFYFPIRAVLWRVAQPSGELLACRGCLRYFTESQSPHARTALLPQLLKPSSTCVAHRPKGHPLPCDQRVR